MSWLRRGATLLAIIGILSQNAAQAATYYYYRGGATAQTTASAPAPPNNTGTFAILVDGPSVATRGNSYSATTYPYYNVGAVSYSILSGSLPAGISLNPSTGTISGSPTVNGQTQAVIQAIDAGTSKTATASFTLDVVDPFGISGNPGTAVNVGTAYSTTFFAFGGTQPYQFSSTGLPPGLSATSSATSTTISGNPSAAGSYNITVTGTDANGLTAAYPYTLSVIGALTIAGTPPATGNVGTPYTGSVAASGGTGPYTYALAAGSLPAGVTLKTATGIISGTPTLAQSKTGIRIRVTDAVGATFTSNAFSITITAAQPLAISGNPPTTVQEGSVYSSQYSASGGTAPYTFTLASGLLPAGISLNSATGLISGVPAAGSQGSYTFAVKVADNAAHTATASTVTLTVTAVPLTVAGARDETIERDVAFTKTYTAAGGSGAGYVYSMVGSFPPGLSLDPSTGTVSGSPTTYGTYSGLQIKVEDSLGATASTATFALTVISASPLQLLGNPSASAQQGQPYSAEFDAYDGSGTGYSFASAGSALPDGLALINNGATSVLLTGTPTKAGDYSGIKLKVTDSLGNVAYSISFTITVGAPPVVADPLSILGNPPQASLGQPYSTQFGAGGGAPPYSYALTGALPDGLSFDAASATISGTPTSVGSWGNIQVTVTDSASHVASTAPFSIAVVDGNPLTISWSPQTSWSVGDTLIAVPTVSGGNAGTYTFGYTGTLPSAVTQNPDGSISGALTTTGTWGPITLTVTDGVRSAATSSVTFTVGNPPLSITSSLSSVASEGYAYESDFFARGGAGSGYVFSLAQGTLPTGLSLNSATGVLSGVPGTGSTGNYDNIVVQVSDGSSTAQSAPFSIFVMGATADASLITASPTRAGNAILGNLSTSLANPSWTFGQSPASPSLALTASGSSFSGVAPNVASSTTYTITATASDGGASVSAAPLSLTVLPLLTIANAPSGMQNGVLGNAFGPTQAPSASGVVGNRSFALVQFGTSFDIAAACPGLTFNAGNATIAGTPTATCSVGNLAIRLSDSADGDAVDSSPSFGIAIADGAATAALTSPGTVHSGAILTGTLSSNLSSPTWSFAQTPAAPALGLSATGSAFSGTAPVVTSQTTFSIAPTASQGGTSVNAPGLTVTVKPSLAITGGATGTISGLTGSALSSAAPTTANSIGTISYALIKAGSAYSSLDTDCPGLSFSVASGAITGTPSAPCAVSGLIIRVTDAFDGTTATTATPFTINVTDPTLVVSGTPTGATYGQAYSFQLNAAGGSHSGFAFSLASGSLPAGLSLSSSGLISGIPSNLTGTSGIVVAVTDSHNNTAQSAPFAISVSDPSPITISWSPTTSLIGGQAISFPVTISGGNPANYAFSNGGTAVAGLSVNAATGTLSGSMPTAAGSYGPVKIVVTDGLRTVSTSAATFTVSSATASAVRTSSTVARTGATITGTLSTNVPSPTWSFATTPASPALGLSASGSTFSGTAPSISAPTTYSIVATAANGASSASATAVVVTVAPTFAVSGGPTSGITGVATTAIATTPAVTFGTTNVGTPTFAVMQGGTAYDVVNNCGLSLDSSGRISGTPTKACSASGLTIRATDSDGATASTATPFGISIAAAPAAPTVLYPTQATVGTAYGSPAPTANGGVGPYTWSVSSGALPPGVAFNASTGALSGTPTTAGSYSFQVVSIDSASRVSPATPTTVTVGTVVTPSVTTIDTPGSGSYTVPPYTTLTVEVWGGGGSALGFNTGPAQAAGIAGGSSTVSSPGTTTQTATGGSGPITGGAAGAPGAAGSGSGGNAGADATGIAGTIGGTTAGKGVGGSAANGGGNAQPFATAQAGGTNGTVPGGGGSGMHLAAGYYSAGSGGGYSKSVYTFGAAGSPAVGQVFSYNVGAGGALPGNLYNGGAGANGRVRFTIGGHTATMTLTNPVPNPGWTQVQPNTIFSGTLSTSMTSPTWTFTQTPASPALNLTASGSTFSGTAPSVSLGQYLNYSITATATQGGVSVTSPVVNITVGNALLGAN